MLKTYIPKRSKNRLNLSANFSSKIFINKLPMSMRYVHPKDSIKRTMEDLAKFESLATNLAVSEEMNNLNTL